MKDEKNLHELSDDMLEDISGGKFDEERESYRNFIERIEFLYSKGIIDEDSYEKFYQQGNAYLRYVRALIKINMYDKTILFDETVDWQELCRKKIGEN